ncbi:MAG: sodium:calcium antiporter, partial [Chloroflexi bacterium]|nr:sodium:calcium antiporter [Chloroflexota bacterium]
MTITLLWLQLAGAALFILFASNYLAKSADVIAIKTGLGRSFAGVVLLATATSLPELGTGVSSIVVFDAPDLAAGDAFGSNIFNLMIIGLLDLYWRNGPILNRVSTTSVAVGALGILIISIAVIALFVHDATSALNSLPISPFSVVIFLVFLASMYVIYVL